MGFGFLPFPTMVLVTVMPAIAAPSRPIMFSFVSKRDLGVSALSADALAAFTPFTQFARAAYCDSSKVVNWTCGEACDALPGFEPTLTGGDGDAIQLFFVGYWPSQDTIIVSHEGTDPTALESDLTDIDTLKTTLDATLFPGVPDGVETHDGFTSEHAKTASQILTEVKSLMNSKGTNNVTLIGHPLGGALAELDSLFIRLNIPSAVVKGVTYGTPRVGNAAFATFFNEQVTDFTRVTNRQDLVPIVPGRFLDFEHPAGQVHIISDGNAVSCTGDENESEMCTDGAVSNILEGSVIDHLGPYEGIHLGTLFCT